MDDILKNLGNVVRQHRLAKNISTQELAAKLEISTGLINNIENAKTDAFSFKLLYNLCTELEIPVVQLLLINHKDLKNTAPNVFGDILIEKLNELDSSDELSFIKSNLGLIIDSYLSTISVFSFKEDAINLITEKIINELACLKKLKQL